MEALVKVHFKVTAKKNAIFIRSQIASFITKLDIFNKLKESSAFSFNNRYLANVFYSIMPDTKTAGIFTVGKP